MKKPEPSPSILTSDKTLKPRIAGRTKTSMQTHKTKQVFFLDQFVKSITIEIMFSKTAKTVEKAAKKRNKKNKQPQILPPSILLKILGKVIKISGGPASG